MDVYFTAVAFSVKVNDYTVFQVQTRILSFNKEVNSMIEFVYILPFHVHGYIVTNYIYNA